MNWDAIGAIAELLGAVGVIASLVYLATQIRGSREATKAMVRQDVSQSAMAFLGAGIDPQILTAARVKQSQGMSLDTTESTMVFTHNMMDFKGMEGTYRLHSMGYVDDDDWNAVKNVIRIKFRRDPIALAMWGEREGYDVRALYPADFAMCVNELRDEVTALVEEIVGEEADRGGG